MWSKVLVGIFVLVCGLSFLERYFGLKEEKTLSSKCLYIVYKILFFISFSLVWLFVFFVISDFVIMGCQELIRNQKLQFSCHIKYVSFFANKNP
jgi:uncharacterized membrane protein HdeD (DUF308 family)